MSFLTTHLRRHAVGYLALFVALSGVAYAATAPKNSVTSKSIKNGQVKTKDLGNKAVSSAKLKNGAVTEGKLGVPLDFVPNANVTRIAFSESGCGAAPGCEAHPEIPFEAADFDLVINCTNEFSGDGVRLHMAVFKPGGRTSGQATLDTTVLSPTVGTGNGAIVNGNDVTLNSGTAAGSFVGSFETSDEAHTVSVSGVYQIDATGTNTGACIVDGVAVGV